MIWFFVFFFISGFCSVLYELVWLRLSMAQFGVTTAMVSIVLSVFMGGLGWGSWLAGAWIRKREEKIGAAALRIYAIIELMIGVSAIVVPYELGFGRRILVQLGSASSAVYYIVSGVWVAVAMLPWCSLMGATIPVGMLAIRRMFPPKSSGSFSYLYMANVAGALFGTVIPLALIELLGFHGTLQIGAICNCSIAGLALILSAAKQAEKARPAEQVTPPEAAPSSQGKFPLVLLFATGLTSMGMEVAWVREFTPFLGTVVYAFATILGVYLAATFLGSTFYRVWFAGRVQAATLLWSLLPLAAMCPFIAANPNLQLYSVSRVALGIAPFAGLLGFLTPMLIDQWAGGNPTAAGKAYAINVTGCILGPLVAGFFLLPWISERWALLIFTLPWLIVGMRPAIPRLGFHGWTPRIAALALPLVALAIFLAGNSYEQELPANSEIMRDSTATVVATGSGMKKVLLVNGYGMTYLTPVTKMMAHLPLAFLDRKPQDALVICFGMGTTFRSLHSWGVPVTVVELVPSVPQLFGYFHKDASEVLSSPLSHVVVDDGRRYLERTSQRYDVITIDPPPPVETAGSSLLYSKDFYDIVRQHLRSGGILQQWLPSGDRQVLTAVARALTQSFPYVRIYGYGPHMGIHFLASDLPLPLRTAPELAGRLPAAAVSDMVEWGPSPDPQYLFAVLLQHQIPVQDLLAMSPATPALSDDRPINEYYLLRTSTQH